MARSQYHTTTKHMKPKILPQAARVPVHLAGAGAGPLLPGGAPPLAAGRRLRGGQPAAVLPAAGARRGARGRGGRLRPPRHVGPARGGGQGDPGLPQLLSYRGPGPQDPEGGV